MGVRSFDNTRGEIIIFQTPLTLIVGFNGSGKTTIIECLKYATTGQQPPNSVKGAFIHDPKLCGEKEVMAQVKLRLKDTQGNKVVVTRSVSLTSQRGGAYKMTTLDGNLLIDRNGERTSTSNKVAGMNEAMLDFLGVSPAILDNVIFCHQDDSLWPMSDPLSLKKKFDLIFDASKYTKVIDNLKVVRKKYMEEVKLLEQTERTEKINKEKGERLVKKTKVLQEVVDKLVEDLAVVDQEIKDAGAFAMQKRKEAKKASTAVEDLKAKTQKAEGVQESIDSLKSYMVELQDSDEWLESTIAQYSERMAQNKEEQEGYSVEYSELKDSLKDLGRQMSQKQAELGQHQAQKEQHERNLEKRVKLIKESARRHGVRGYEGDVDSDQIQDFISRIVKASKDKDRELERIRKATSDEIDEAQAAINDLEQRRTTQTQSKVFSRQTINKNETETNAKQKLMGTIKMDEGTKAGLVTLRNDVQERLQKMDADYEAAAWDQNLKKGQTQLTELKEESRKLVDEITQVTNQSSARAQLDLAKKNAKQQQSSLDTMKATHNGELVSVVGTDWRVDTLEREFYTVVEQRAREVADAKKQHEGVKDEYNRVDYQLKQAREDLKKNKETMQKCEAAVLASITTSEERPLSSVEDYQTELESLESERDDYKTQVDGADFATKYFKECLGYLNKNNACRLCTRKFADQKEQSTAMQKINARLTKFAEDELQKELDDLEEHLRKANSARSQYEKYNTLKAELPSLEKELQKLETAKADALARLEKHDGVVSVAESTKRDIEALTETVRAISLCSSEIAKHESEVTRLSSQQSLSGASRSTDEIQQQMAACDEQIRTLEAKIGKMSSNKEKAKTARNDLERELDALSSKLTSADHLLENKRGLLSRIEELRESTTQLRESIQQADSELQLLGPQIDKAIAQLKKVQARGRTKENEVQTEKTALSETVNKIDMIEGNVNQYIAAGGPGKLASCQREIDTIEQDQNRIESDVAKVTEKANELKDMLRDSETTLRSMKDNVRYRNLLKQLKVLQNEIGELELRNVADDWEKLEHEAVRAEKMSQNLIAKRGPVFGEIKSKDEELRKYLTEWETDYKDAAVRYRQALVNLTSTKAVTDDVAKLHKAVDQAIMKYHSMKMEEINAIASDLWQKTYQGTDIDTIMIRSDDDDESTVARNSYKYRVVMVKQDTEMDMRGRCSAGQKVLACIIIRLALAECFGVNCGVSNPICFLNFANKNKIIALDEPTTNLDQDNIQALAKALHGIIEARKHQANFQLIIITHDEEFLRHMHCNDFTEHYYRVSRDDRQKSVIEWQPITDLMAS
ncbi:DNA repair protein RAD50 [Lachnellula cervina]|uniref:DNA repair protein RAD50 n=1 Tax=Lachnellula cervina TaxID=1316786 RepID=A0A7D8YW69_9HELO|nr:DNA repair protein RAD50 [Lachnellula cervina]